MLRFIRSTRLLSMTLAAAAVFAGYSAFAPSTAQAQWGYGSGPRYGYGGYRGGYGGGYRGYGGYGRGYGYGGGYGRGYGYGYGYGGYGHGRSCYRW